MDLHYLKLFNIFASELNFSKTADMLYISQPAVSIQIKKLENDLGLRLFDRVGKNIYLNENGKLLYRYTQKIFALVEEVEHELYNQNKIARGTINVGASNTPGTYIIPHILGEFIEMYPLVETDLHISNTYEVERMVLENKVDFAINGGYSTQSSSLYMEKLVDDEIVFVASPINKLSRKYFIETDDLRDSSYIVHEKSSQLYELIINILAELELPANIKMMLGNIDAIKQAVSANLGISAIPHSAVRTELRTGVLKQLKFKDKHWNYQYNLIYHKKRQLPFAALKFIELIRQRIGQFCR